MYSFPVYIKVREYRQSSALSEWRRYTLLEGLEEMLSVTQAAQYLGVERKTIYDAIKAQRLVATQLMGKTAVRQADLDSFRDKELRPNVRRTAQER